jgi:5-methylcytosine-specific restriction endonuclease McrA
VPFAGAKDRYRRLPEPIRQAVLERDHHTCTMVGHHEGRLEVDHIIPQSRGGSDDMSNLRTLCRYHHLHLPNVWGRRG